MQCGCNLLQSLAEHQVSNLCVVWFSSVTLAQCRTKGTCLALTVLDYDVLSNDDIEGHAFLPLDTLSGLDTTILGGFVNEPQTTMNLMHPLPEGLSFDSKFPIECSYWDRYFSFETHRSCGKSFFYTKIK